MRLKFLKEQLGEKVDVEEDIRRKILNIGDCCTLTFYEFGNVHVLSEKVDISRIEKTNGPLLFLTNYVLLLLLLLLRDRDTDSHCPFLMVWLEPSDLFNQEKKSSRVMLEGRKEGRKERADKGKADQKARKAKGKANVRSCGIASIRKDISIDCCELPIRIDDGFQWRPLLHVKGVDNVYVGTIRFDSLSGHT